ncbi:MAG: hypothetical protein MJZ14_00565 [Paludibacteraceae bacterium]|nr:hypothetical protein [Paludibacteraceae bacterium]
MRKIEFNLMQIIVENEKSVERFVNPNKEMFDVIDRTSYSLDGTYYDVKYENQDEYLWLYFNYGKSFPRNDKIINVGTGEERDNSREVDEAELLGQLFVCYSYKKQLLYISSIKKKTVVESFLKENIGLNIEVKSFYKNKEEFISVLDKVDKIRFTQANNLFAQNSKQRQALIDLTGTDAPESFTIEASYNSHKLDGFLNTLFNCHEQSQIDALVICGRDESNMSFVYNLDSFCKKIEILVEKDDSGLYNPDSVKQSLLNNISDER